jgi:DNA repair protein RadC
MMILRDNELKTDLSKSLAAPARRALDAAGIQRLEQLTKLSMAEIKQWHGIGSHALIQLHLALASRDLAFENEN